MITGQGEACAAVTIRDAGGATLGTAVVAANGSYAAILTTPQVNGQALSVTQADAAGNASTPAAVTAPDLTPPAAPIGLVSGDGTTLTGTGEAGATGPIPGCGGGGGGAPPWGDGARVRRPRGPGTSQWPIPVCRSVRRR